MANELKVSAQRVACLALCVHYWQYTCGIHVVLSADGKASIGGEEEETGTDSA